jgi:hypothetical protein
MRKDELKTLVKECVNIIQEELDFVDQLRLKYKQAKKEQNPEKMVYYSQSFGKSAVGDFDTQFKGSWAYGEWLKKNQAEIENAKKELKRFSWMEENEMYDQETDSFSHGPRDRTEPVNHGEHESEEVKQLKLMQKYIEAGQKFQNPNNFLSLLVHLQAIVNNLLKLHNK